MRPWTRTSIALRSWKPARAATLTRAPIQLSFSRSPFATTSGAMAPAQINAADLTLLYPTSLKLDVSSFESFSVALVPYDVRAPIPDEHADADILVTWTNTNLKDAAGRLRRVRWIQSLAAGPNDVLGAGFDPTQVVITTGSGLHDHTVAEHTLGLLLSSARRLHEMRDSQLQGRWPGHLGGPQPDRPADRFTTLRDAHVTVWGFGNIAKALVPSLRLLGAHVTGVARSAGVRDGVEVVAEADLPALLAHTDALVMILPGSDATRHVLNADRLRLLPAHAWVVNVGRGSCIDEEALADALDQGRLGGAALDVFETEPLPPTSRLWKTPNLVISPHAAGGRPQGAERLIAENLRRFIAGQPLKNVI
ncbi:phosphoglycerate dehydrogenase-like oxidoreductase [Grosmannia clavigera kw1407]|uniref:Phosphoglycerate dehydrogenase-like oxidoreductase n=1 Tax=Grosmannia clavigera (strain kw1407 / UAMH 11150) TaxID=655863 RepID=F0X729_GROCL|nr:phosphoglycerate dehydrogenase-like oxidoreductase [Grosmannia clavigera kw1407]EFX06631.1 phosphoglycerate dehydrogenase-like oxidoreductase [Grosmannia clavigera kw1407]